MTLIICVLLVALAFEYINGFHDTANSIATVVSTKVLTPRQAIILAAFFNLVGAMTGQAVASTISSGLVDASFVTTETIICALLSAIVWNLLTWYFGLPSSSSHALVGGLCGAAIAAAHGNFGVLIWSKPAADHWWKGAGLLFKVVIPMIASPMLGLLGGFLLMALLYYLLRNWKPRTVNVVFGRLQLASASYMGFSHGTNDAQKTMGIIALALLTATHAGTFDHVPSMFKFLVTHDPAPNQKLQIALWIKVTCAVTMALGTAAGGWRIIKTLGHKMVKLQPVHGFAAETTSASILFLAAKLGMPVSTTHAITTSIMGVGAAKNLKSIKWRVVNQIIIAWIFTLPVTGLLAYLLVRALQGMALHK